MHRSAIGAVCIDLPEGRYDRASTFWKDALGTAARQGVQHPEYEVLEAGIGGVTGLLQCVGDERPRVHLDIHTDDVAAEVARLIRLGATEAARHDDWVVLEDPAGLTFCVVPVAPDDPLLDAAPRYGD